MAIKEEYTKSKPKPAKPVETNDFGKKIKKKVTFLPKKGDSPKELLQKIVYLAAIVTLLGSLYILADYYIQDYKNSKEINSLQEKYSSLISETTSTTTTSSVVDEPRPLLPAAQALLKDNSDTIGWVKINNTKVDLPVVLKNDPTDGNSFYLNHSFKKEQSSAGTIFADFRTTIEDRKQSDNIVLYGHNEASNKMFGDLDLYKQKGFNKSALEFYKQNPTIQFNTNYEEGTYKIFAYFVTAVEESQDKQNPIFDYNNYINFDEARYNDFMQNIMKRNKIVTDVDCKFGDKFLTLSTCSNEFEPSRFVIFARKVRPDEDPSVNVSNVTYNENALEPDWDTIYNR